MTLEDQLTNLLRERAGRAEIRDDLSAIEGGRHVVALSLELDLDRTTPATMDFPQVGHGPAGRRGRGLLTMAAAAVLIVGVVGVVAVWQQRDPLPMTESPVDPAGALFVLPAQGSGFASVNGYVMQSAGSALGGRGFVYATPDGSAYRTLFVVTAGDGPRGLGFSWDYVLIPPAGSRVAQSFRFSSVDDRRGSRWVKVESRSSNSVALFDLLERSTVNPDGTVSAEARDDRAVIDTFEVEEPLATSTTGFDVTDVATGRDLGIAVETTSSPSALIPAAFVADEAEPITVRGVQGWRVTRRDADGQWNGIVWLATPNRVIAVSGYAELDQILDVAAHLVITDDATWKAALPDYLGN